MKNKKQEPVQEPSKNEGQKQKEKQKKKEEQNKKERQEETKEITKDMTFADALDRYPEAGEIFMGQGMHCVGCPMAMMETIEEGCKGHGLDPDEIVKKVNEKLKKG